MKNLFFLLLLTALSFNLSAQSSAENMLKRVLHGRVNEIFLRWDDSWSVDRYIDESATISYFEESSYSANTLIAHGSFTVNRTIVFTSKVNVKFTCKVRVNANGSTKIINVCYQDGSASQTDCVDPSKWGLDEL